MNHRTCRSPLLSPRWAFLLAVLLLFGADPPAAHAGKKAKAKAMFRQGQQDFKDEDYASALKNFRKAHKLTPHPDILFMVGQSYRNLKRYAKAIEAFEGYLEAKPEASDKAEVERLIEELEFLKEVSSDDGGDEVKNLDEPDEDKPKPMVAPKPPKAPPSPTPVKKKKTPVYKKWWFWAAVGGGLAAAGVGTYFIAREAGGAEIPTGSLGSLDLR